VVTAEEVDACPLTIEKPPTAAESMVEPLHHLGTRRRLDAVEELVSVIPEIPEQVPFAALAVADFAQDASRDESQGVGDSGYKVKTIRKKTLSRAGNTGPLGSPASNASGPPSKSARPLGWKRLVPLLVQVTGTAVVVMRAVSRGVSQTLPPDKRAQFALDARPQHVPMVRHQAIRQESGRAKVHRLRHQPLECIRRDGR